VELEGREQANDAGRHAKGGLDERVVLGHLGVRQAVEAATDSVDHALFDEARQGLPADPDGLEVAAPKAPCFRASRWRGS